MPQTVLITGASTGIGKATAELFYERGWNVVATMRTPGKNGRADPRWLETRLDVTDAGSIQAALVATKERFGKLDVVVNNAGYGLVGTFESMDEARIQRQFETNVFGLMRVVRAVLPQFRAARAGVIVNVSSMGGRLTFPFYSAYHATKWAVDGFSESLAFELEPLGIRVRIIEPGAIKTDFYERSADFVHDRSLTQYNEIVDKAMRRYDKAAAKGAPASVVAEAIYKAANDKSSRLRYVVGSDAKGLLAMRRVAGVGAYRAAVRGQILR
jgi:NAD(P)-dependent dehydrogenase (short-subunit alcohol dehydrogenase family)